MLDFESALARAEAAAGIIPAAAAEAITSCCKAELFDLCAIADEAAQSGNLAIPIVKQLTSQVHRTAAEYVGFVHWGATSQDAIDTGTVLQLRQECKVLDDLLRRTCERLAALCDEYRDVPMAGRTWVQHAVPVTFGLVVAGWLDAMMRHRHRLAELTPRIVVLQFGGAAGTLASLGQRGLEVSRRLADDLGLALPLVSWHAQGDRFAEAGAFRGLVMGTAGKIAQDLSLLMQTEIAEVAEPEAVGRGGSSTMPHKRNPVACAAILTSATRVPGLVSTMFAAMLQEHQRGLSGWQAGWETLPEICRLTLGSLERLLELLNGLVVDREAMRRNLDRTQGLLMAEAVSMAVSEKVGKTRAHSMVEEASRRAIAQRITLREAVEADDALMQQVRPDQLEDLFDPLHYLGDTRKMIDAVLHAYREQTAGDQTKGT
jgi:3-carboxy-cis,cis-muconate cycloisomerase